MGSDPTQPLTPPSAPATATSDRNAHAALLSEITRLMSRWSSLELQRRITAECGVALDPVAVRAIYLLGLEGGSARPSTLADELHLTRPSTSKLIARLTGADVIERLRDPADRRSVAVALTESGREVFLRLFSAGVDMVDAATDDWDRADVQAFGALLHRFVGGLLRPDPAPGNREE